MGQMAELALAQARQENVALRRALAQAQGMFGEMQAQYRAMAMEQAFIAAALQTQAVSVSGQSLRSERIAECISIGRETARLYIEQLSAEAAEEGALRTAEQGANKGGTEDASV